MMMTQIYRNEDYHANICHKIMKVIEFVLDRAFQYPCNNLNGWVAHGSGTVAAAVAIY